MKSHERSRLSAEDKIGLGSHVPKFPPPPSPNSKTTPSASTSLAAIPLATDTPQDVQSLSPNEKETQSLQVQMESIIDTTSNANKDNSAPSSTASVNRP